jgi:hypothetical protein
MSNAHRYEYMVHPDDRGKPAFKQRQYNPFDMGYLGNCAAFWRADVDWGSVGEVEAVLVRGREKADGGDAGEFV